MPSCSGSKKKTQIEADGHNVMPDAFNRVGKFCLQKRINRSILYKSKMSRICVQHQSMQVRRRICKADTCDCTALKPV